LQTVLTSAYAPLDPAAPPLAQISDLQGNISTDPARVTIFLFEAVEDPSAKNRPRVRAAPPPPPPPSCEPDFLESVRDRDASRAADSRAITNRRDHRKTRRSRSGR
jgi:hypothetical protein